MVTYETHNASLVIDGDTVRLDHLEIRDKSLVEYLENLPPDDYSMGFVQLVEIGLACRQRAASIQDRDFARNQMQEVISQVEKVLLGIPDVVKEKVIAGIGTGDGQVLQPIERKVDEVSRAMKTRIDDAVKFLAEDIDPDKETSRVAKVFSRLEKALDPDYVKSVPSTIELSLKEITGVDGQLAKNVRSVVMDSIKPLQDQVNRLSREIVGQDAVDEAIQETTVKGIITRRPRSRDFRSGPYQTGLRSITSALTTTRGI